MSEDIHVLVGQTVTVTAEYLTCKGTMSSPPDVDNITFGAGAMPSGWTYDLTDPAVYILHCTSNPGSLKVTLFVTQGGIKYQDDVTIIASVNEPDPNLCAVKAHYVVS
jgi:hypothetical protein